jgi:hypothetical protein
VPVGPRFGFYGVVIQLALALGLGIFVSVQGAGELGPSDHVERGIALGLLFAVPGVIAVLGIRSSRPTPVIAAVVMDMAGLILSYATLVFVVPTAFFVAHAAATAQGPRRIGSVVRGALVGVALVGLVVGAGIALFAMTEGRCWTAYASPNGTIYRLAPYVDTGETIVPPDAMAAGCDTGVLTLQGEGTAAVLALGAIALAGLATRRREEPVTS